VCRTFSNGDGLTRSISGTADTAMSLYYKFSTECAGENRSIFGNDIDKSLRITFLGQTCISLTVGNANRLK